MNRLTLRLFGFAAGIVLTMIALIHLTGLLQRGDLSALGNLWAGITLVVAFALFVGAFCALFAPDKWLERL